MVVTERVTGRLPAGFNPDRHDEGFEILSTDPAGGTVYATRHVAITEVSAGDTPAISSTSGSPAVRNPLTATDWRRGLRSRIPGTR